jgi:purine nucleosidase
VIASLLQPALFEGRNITVVTKTKGGHTPGTTVADGCRLTKRAPNAMVMGGVDRDGF